MTKRLTALATASVLVFALGACGSDKKASTTPGGADGSTTVGGGTTKAGGTTATGSAPGGNKGFDALQKLASKATYKVTYKADGSDSITMVNDPPRAAFITGSTAVYQTADGKSVNCDGTGASATCTELPSAASGVAALQTGLFGIYGTLFKTFSSQFGALQTSTETIAGRKATCIHFDISKYVPTEKGSADICADTELGLTLRMKSTDNTGKATTVFEATSVSTSVSEADVTPPATPVTIPSIP